MSHGIQPTRPGFWQRQFQGQRSRKQLWFDVVFGIVGPILCFAFDPLAFRGGILGQPLFGEYQTFAYLFSGFEILVLAAWLLLGAELQFLNNFVSGILVSGGIFCAILGCLLIPYSLVGLVIVVGILGFTPFVTAFVYFRNGYRAVMSTGGLAAQPWRAAPFLLGCVLTFAGSAGLTMGINQVVSDSVETIIHGDDQQASNAAKLVRPLSFVSGAKLERLVTEYVRESDNQRKERLKRSYKEATGEDITTKAAILMD